MIGNTDAIMAIVSLALFVLAAVFVPVRRGGGVRSTPPAGRHPGPSKVIEKEAVSQRPTLESNHQESVKVMNMQQALELSHERVQQKPHCAINMKDTDACLTLHCTCGCSSHVDGFFLYVVQCPRCKTTYALSTHMECFIVEDTSGYQVNEMEGE